jgi:ABC-type molybdate transport system ATPase subunit
MVVLERGRAVASGAIGDLFGRTDTPLLSERADAGALLDLQVIANDRAGSVTARIGAQTMVVAADVRVGTNLRAYVLANEVILASARPTGISVRNGILKVSHYINLMRFEGESFAHRLSRLMLQMANKGFLQKEPNLIFPRYVAEGTVERCLA